MLFSRRLNTGKYEYLVYNIYNLQGKSASIDFGRLLNLNLKLKINKIAKAKKL